MSFVTGNNFSLLSKTLSSCSLNPLLLVLSLELIYMKDITMESVAWVLNVFVLIIIILLLCVSLHVFKETIMILQPPSPLPLQLTIPGECAKHLFKHESTESLWEGSLNIFPIYR